MPHSIRTVVRLSRQSRAALLVAALACLPAAARADIVSIAEARIAGAEGGATVFKNIAIEDGNLSQAEAASLFNGTLSREDLGALLGRMQAKKVTIPEADITAANGDRFTVHDIVADTIAQGGVQALSLASIDGVLPDDSGDSNLRAGAVRIEKISMPGLAAALRAGDPGLAAFRFGRLTWDGGDLSVVDKGTPAGAPGGNRIALHFGPATVDQSFDPDGAPLAGSASLTGISLKLPPQSKGGASLAAFGFPELTGEFHYTGAYDPGAKIYQLKTYGIDVKNVGRLAFSGQFSGVAKTSFIGEKEAREKSLRESFLDWFQIDLTNAGLFEKVVAFASLSERKTPDAVKTEWRAILSQLPLLFSAAPAVTATAQAVDRFIANPTTLTLRVKGKDSPLKLDEFTHIDDPTAFLNRLDVTSGPTSPGSNAGSPAAPGKSGSGIKP
jgi:hypothetical protein